MLPPFERIREGLAELEPASMRDSLTPVVEREGLTVMAGQLPEPWHTHSLFVLTLANRGALGTDAEAAGAAESASFFKDMNAEVEAVMKECPEQKALDAAEAAYSKIYYDELEPLEKAAREAAAAVAAAGVKERQAARRVAEDAEATLKDFREHVAGFERKRDAAEAALPRKRQALRAEHIKKKQQELKARRDALKSFATGTIVTIGSELLALRALERAIK
jgi:hypothetical protein